ncbi:6105_t:CDS:2 [Entrophospora sp. SA101]|nr:6105_t:CDS:2 [Entrophospora sp. SA101]
MSRSKDYPVSLISVGSLKENLHFGDFSQNWWETRQSNNSNDIDNISILYPIRIGMETMVILNETRFFITVVQGCEGSLYQPGYICEVNGKKSEVFSNSSAAITNTYQELFSSKSKFSENKSIVVPTKFTWKNWGKDITIAGTFDAPTYPVWKPIAMPNGEVEINLIPKKRYYYKFVIDHNWVLDPNLASYSDEHGNWNHEIVVEQPIPPSPPQLPEIFKEDSTIIQPPAPLLTPPEYDFDFENDKYVGEKEEQHVINYIEQHNDDFENDKYIGEKEERHVINYIEQHNDDFENDKYVGEKEEQHVINYIEQHNDDFENDKYIGEKEERHVINYIEQHNDDFENDKYVGEKEERQVINYIEQHNDDLENDTYVGEEEEQKLIEQRNDDLENDTYVGEEEEQRLIEQRNDDLENDTYVGEEEEQRLIEQHNDDLENDTYCYFMLAGRKWQIVKACQRTFVN